MMSHLPNPPNLDLPTWDDLAPASLLSDVDNRNPLAGSFQNIPLQTLTRHSALPNDNEDGQPDTNASQSGQEQNEITDEDGGLPAHVPPETENGQGETLARKPTRVLEKWQLRLNASQVFFGLLGCAGSWATIKLTIYGWKLSQWTAWMTFRDECRALLSEPRDITPDCKEVLRQPLSKPPLLMDGISPHHGQNISLDARTAFGVTYAPKLASSLRVPGISISPVLSVLALSVVLLFLWLWYILTRRNSPRREFGPIELCRPWVQDHVARLQDESKGYTTAQDAKSWLGIVRRRVGKKMTTRVQRNYDQFETYRPIEQEPQNGLEENEETQDEGPWIPCADASEEPSTPPSDYLHFVQLILDKLYELGYTQFAFDRLNGHADLDPYLAAVQQTTCSCGYSDWSKSTAWSKDVRTSNSISPLQLVEEQGQRDFNLEWLIEISLLSHQEGTTCLTYAVNPEGTDGTWKLWQSQQFDTAVDKPSEEPRLYVLKARGRHIRLLFKDVSIEEYGSIMEKLAVDNKDHGQCHTQDCWQPQITRWEMKFRTKIIKKIFLAASTDSLDRYSEFRTHQNGGTLCEGSYTEDLLDDWGESARLLVMNHDCQT